MPRVNRDLQRRMAARRERDRRRPTGERRYQFAAPSEPALEADEALLGQNGEGAEGLGASESPPDGSRQTPTRGAPGATTERSGRAMRGAPAVAAGAAATRGARPFSAYKDEYAYVTGDLRRVAAVIGGLLLALIVLYFVLPLLVH